MSGTILGIDKEKRRIELISNLYFLLEWIGAISISLAVVISYNCIWFHLFVERRAELEYTPKILHSIAMHCYLLQCEIPRFVAYTAQGLRILGT